MSEFDKVCEDILKTEFNQGHQGEAGWGFERYPTKGVFVNRER